MMTSTVEHPPNEATGFDFWGNTALLPLWSTFGEG
jgi:hypothetical protein